MGNIVVVEDFEVDEMILDLSKIEMPLPFLPICICIDTSNSIKRVDSRCGENPLNEVNSTIARIYEAIKSEELLYHAAEICLISFGSSGVLASDFNRLYYDEPPIYSELTYISPLAESIRVAVDCLSMRVQQYEEAGVDYYQPCLYILTDGLCTDPTNELIHWIEHINDLENKNKLVVIPIAIGNNCDWNVLKSLSKKQSPIVFSNTNQCDYVILREILSDALPDFDLESGDVKLNVELSGIDGWGPL